MIYEPPMISLFPLAERGTLYKALQGDLDKLMASTALKALSTNRSGTNSLLNCSELGVSHLANDNYSYQVRKILAVYIGADNVRPPSATISPSMFDRPAVECTDAENSTFKVKPRQTYLRTRMVEVKQSSSSWGHVEVSSSFIGKIISTTDSNVTVEVIFASRDGELIVKGSRRNAVGRVVTVGKRSAEILDPWMMTVHWYVNANRAYLMSRNHELSRKMKDRYARSPLNPMNDPRVSFRRFDLLYMTPDNYKRHNDTIRAQGKIQAYLIAILRAGYFQGFALDNEVKRKLCATMKPIDAENISNSDMMRKAITRYNSSLEPLEDEDGDETSESIGRKLSYAYCSHVERNDRMKTVYIFGSFENVCSHCAEQNLANGTYVLLLNADGVEQLCLKDSTIYEWSDGTRRFVPEPEIIGQYHSSKRYIGKLTPVVGEAPSSGLTLGIELEMEKVGGEIRSDEERNKLARLVCDRMFLAHVAGGIPVSRSVKQYAFFERDGSVANGFEMVSGWGNLATHRHFIRHIFGMVNGENKMPFVGKLVSHDATASCGLHVHMAKPNNLIHAAKLQAFYQDKNNARLIRAVARRMDVRYAKVAEGKGKDEVRKNVSKAIRDTGYSLTETVDKPGRRRVQRQAITCLNNNDRYQMVNFCNEKTVEIRVFKGSMLPVTILACIEFAHASWFFSRDLPADRLTSDEFLQWIASQEHRHETANLRAYLAVRGFKTYVPNKHHSVPEDLHEFNADGA